ncbi:MAG: class I SAM-dependent methyltransferase [Myxococcota bacterium]
MRPQTDPARDTLPFTGERLHADEALFGVDLLRHRAAYQHALAVARSEGARTILELGSGTGYGATELAASGLRVVAVDRVAPLASARAGTARFVRADLGAMPFVGGRFDLAVSFQVVEHLADPAPFVAALADALRPGGVALVSTPNRLQSDGENPFHVHEYRADELERLLAARFGSVEMLGVGVRGEALRYHEDRLRRIRRIVRLDPLRLRRRIPRSLVEWLFARFAILVRRGLAADARLPQISLADFPIGPVDPGSLDLLAVCRDPLP